MKQDMKLSKCLSLSRFLVLFENKELQPEFPLPIVVSIIEY